MGQVMVKESVVLVLVGMAAGTSGFVIQACGDSTGPGGGLQSSCVIDQLGLERTLADGQSCSNFGYSDCEGSGSECINYCAHGRCQPGECNTDSDCESRFGAGYECTEYVVSGDSYGFWCRLSDCPKGTLGCPCTDAGLCGSDPFGSGAMTCTASNRCESSCPAACRVGSSVCCGGAFCSGDCIGTPCC